MTSIESAKNPLVSVVILTRDRVESLQRCIRSIVENSYRKAEIIIYDNGTDESQSKIRSFLSGLKSSKKIKHIEATPSGMGSLRKAAVSYADGEIFMSIDDDCVAHKDAISNIVRSFRSDRLIGIVGGNLKNVGFFGKNRFKGRGKIGLNGKYEVVEDPRKATVFGSANQSILRKAYIDAGGYDEFFIGGLEESDLSEGIRQKGYKIVYEPLVKITHYHTGNTSHYRWLDRNVMRLYFFFKHFMPGSFKDWAGFVIDETRLLTDDILKYAYRDWKSPRQTRKMLEKGGAFALVAGIWLFAKELAWRLFDGAKTVISRLIIPYILWRAWRARRDESLGAKV